MTKPKKGNTEDIVRSLAEPIAAELGLRLWDVRFQKEGSNWYLRISIDKDDGILIADCENMSHAIDPILDREDPIEQAYFLEVSSPGLGRHLTRPSHFKEMMGKEIAIHTIRPINNCRDFVGILCDYTPDITIDIAGEKHTFTNAEISTVKLNDDADLF